MTHSIDFYRTLSRLFTNSVFRSVADHGHCDYLLQSVDKYAFELQLQSSDTASQLLQKAYRFLSSHYRSEYYYKNTIANKLLLGRHNLNTTTLLSEFRVGASIADLVMLNGSSTVYEIKTELDSAEKLHKQIADYQKAFIKVNLVTHHSLAAKYEKIIGNSPVGLFCLGNRQQLSEVKPAEHCSNALDTDVMLRSLRKNEYAGIVACLCGHIPSVPNTRFFTACREALQPIDRELVHDQMVVQLKNRNVRHKAFFREQQLPRELVHICLCLDLSPKQFDNLIRFLNNPVSSCISPTCAANNSNYLPFAN